MFCIELVPFALVSFELIFPRHFEFDAILQMHCTLHKLVGVTNDSTKIQIERDRKSSSLVLVSPYLLSVYPQ